MPRSGDSQLDTALNVDAHVRRIIGIHFHPDGGAPYWLEREKALGIDARGEIRTLTDLERLGPMDEEALRSRPVMDFVPRSERGRLAGAVVTETGGATGPPKRTLFARREFQAAFVEPFVRVADATGFPRSSSWLWVGPGGPHVIGQAAAACAAAMDSPQPFAIDFDPRWFRKLPAESLARQRYLHHLAEQALDIIRGQPIGVIFTTPVMLAQLAALMTDVQRARIHGVHYGGMRVEPALLKAAQTEWFPNAVHLAGYGNSLFGLCMEFGGPPERTLRYYPLGVRHHVRVGHDGRVWTSRLDSTVLIANMRERDVATAIPAPGVSWADFGPGVEDPRPGENYAAPQNLGIY